MTRDRYDRIGKTLQNTRCIPSGIHLRMGEYFRAAPALSRTFTRRSCGRTRRRVMICARSRIVKRLTLVVSHTRIPLRKAVGRLAWQQTNHSMSPGGVLHPCSLCGRQWDGLHGSKPTTVCRPGGEHCIRAARRRGYRQPPPKRSAHDNTRSLLKHLHSGSIATYIHPIKTTRAPTHLCLLSDAEPFP